MMLLCTAQELVLEVLQALMSDTKIVKESIQKGILGYYKFTRIYKLLLF